MTPAEVVQGNQNARMVPAGRKKCCMVTCVVILVAIVVAIPLTLFVIAPALGNYAMNKAVMSVTNATVTNVNIGGLVPYSHIEFHDTFVLNNVLPLSAHLGAVNVTLSGLTNESDISTEFVMGYNEMPEMELHPGDNKEFVNTPWLVPADNEKFMEWSLTFPFPEPTNHTVYQRINFYAEVELTAFGIFKLHPKLNKTVCCTTIANPDMGSDMQSLTMSLGCTEIDDLSAPCNKNISKLNDESNLVTFMQAYGSESSFMSV